MGKGSYDEIGNTGQHDPRDLAIFTIGVVVSQVKFKINAFIYSLLILKYI